MTTSIVTQLFEHLDETGLAERPGALLFSGIGTLCPGEIYMLGYNPGGDPETESTSVRTHLESLVQKDPYWNEYIDEIWCPGGRPCAPGQSGMQTRVRALLTGIGLVPQTVCASDLIFVRSRVANDLQGAYQLARRCWPVHRFIIKQIGPRVILSIGRKAFDFISNQGALQSKIEAFPSGRRKLNCYAAQLQLDGQDLTLVSIPHLGDRIRYDITLYPETMAWLREKLVP